MAKTKTAGKVIRYRAYVAMSGRSILPLTIKTTAREVWILLSDDCLLQHEREEMPSVKKALARRGYSVVTCTIIVNIKENP